MKKFFMLFISLLFLPALALDDVGIAKYAVLEVNSNNVPLRAQDNENASRIGHLYKDTVLFADKQNKNYYRVELSENNYAWINKKFIEVQAIIPEKRFDNIEKISFKKDKKEHLVEIKTPQLSAFTLKETDKGLSFTLYDNRFDPIETRLLGLDDSFSFESKMSDSLNLNYRTNKPLFGYDVEKSEKGYVLKIKEPPLINSKKPLKHLKVVVDPGHGGSEKGACAFNLEEKNLNLEISKKLSRELKKRGAKVYLTRKKDVQTGLYKRVDFAKEKNADILLSIHQNSLANPKDIIKKHGVGTYYYNPQAKPLASSIQKSLVLMTGFRDDKVNYASFALTRPTAQISVLIECGYIIRKEEAQKLSDKKFQRIIAKAVVKGCEDYLKDNFLYSRL